MATQSECGPNMDLAQRLSGVRYETLKMLSPIDGYQNVSLVSLKEAIKELYQRSDDSIRQYVKEIRQKIPEIMQRAENPKDGLTRDESAAIFLYTMQMSPKSLYTMLNSTLRTEKRDALKPWFSYLKLLITALCKLPPTGKVTVHRGVKQDLSKMYEPIGKKVVWQQFSSTTLKIEILQSEEFLGKKGQRTRFIIECHSGRRIKNHSYYEREHEILLLPATQFKVISTLDLGHGLHEVQLKEIETSRSLLAPPFHGAFDAPTAAASHQQTRPFSSRNLHQELPLSSPEAESSDEEEEEEEGEQKSIEEFPEKHDVRHLIQQCKKEEKWNLEWQQLDNKDVEEIAETLKKNKYCEHLNLDHNHITNDGLQFHLLHHDRELFAQPSR
jgi:hypothetical protein